MQLKNIGSNMTELQLGDKTILFSYSTPVAYSEKGSCYKTEKKWSNTTSKHINKWLDGRHAETIDQSKLDFIANRS